MMKKLIYVLAVLSLASCSESLEDKAAREAKEYTEKYCPTPFVDGSRTDSAVFDKASRTYIYYITLTGKADNPEIINNNKKKLHNMQKEALDNNPGIKNYKEAHFAFRYIYHSAKDSSLVLLDDVFKY